MDIKEMRHEVIELAISLENFLDEEIRSYFGLDAWNASYNNQIWEDREIFSEFFIRYMSFPNKFKLIKHILKKIGEELYEGFGNDTKKFIEIRNKFAHTIYHETEEEFMSTMQIEWIKAEQIGWDNLYNEIKTLAFKIFKELDNCFYTKDPRVRKYKRFEERELQKAVEYYEKLLEEERRKNNFNYGLILRKLYNTSKIN